MSVSIYFAYHMDVNSCYRGYAEGILASHESYNTVLENIHKIF